MEDRKAALRSLLLGGLLPVIVFTFIEEYFGILWGLLAAMLSGIVELSWEWRKNRKFEKITIFSTSMVLVLGSVSLVLSDGIWLKLQPAIIELVFGAVLLGSVIIGRPLLSVLMDKQNQIAFGSGKKIPSALKTFIDTALSGITLRLAVFFWIHAGLAVWAALRASTLVWAMLKGAGVTVSLVLYMLVEGLVLRSGIRRLVHQK